MNRATAIAHPNIALIKYWGKRDTALNLPAVGSISVTLDELATTTQVRFDPELSADRFVIDGVNDPLAAARASRCIDLLRFRAGTDMHAEITTGNNFPTGAGLASSASGFAALVVAADAALGLGLESPELAILARRGSGSAARSIFGGFVEMFHGEADDGSDCTAQPLLEREQWPLVVTIAIVSRDRKQVGSTVGMEHSRNTSPYYRDWVDHAHTDLDEGRRAIAERDFALLADVAEFSCLKMHALAMASRPGLVYLRGATIEAMHRVRELRHDGHGVFFTIDAGPQLKAISLPDEAALVAAALGEIHGVEEVIQVGLGQGARVVER